MKWLWSFFFGCFHVRTTWPMKIDGRTYVACLKCGSEIPYSWETMRTLAQGDRLGAAAGELEHDITEKVCALWDHIRESLKEEARSEPWFEPLNRMIELRKEYR